MLSPRPYVAAAAASVLIGLYFMPSASASPSEAPAQTVTSPAGATTVTQANATADGSGLADTGAVDTKPYLFGGGLFLVAGAGLVINAGRRSRREADEQQADV